MSLPPKLKIGIGLVVVFIAGGICGSWAHARITEHIFRKSLDCSTWSPAILEGLDHDLHLSPDQKQKAKVMLDQTVDEARHTFGQLGVELVRLHTRIQTILTPEQRAKNAESFARFRRALERYKISLPAETNVTDSSVSQ